MKREYGQTEIIMQLRVIRETGEKFKNLLSQTKTKHLQSDDLEKLCM